MARVAPISLQQSFQNRWNTSREDPVDEVPRRQAEIVCAWLASLGRRNLDIIDVGCGAGWLCQHLTCFGHVTGTDPSNEVLVRAQNHVPEVTFVAGDFMTLEFGRNAFDVVVTLEVLSHVADQEAFVSKLASHLRPGGRLMLATQNLPVLQHLNFIPPPAPGQLRRWVDRHELRALLAPEFEVLELYSVTPKAGHGFGPSLGILRRLRSGGLEWPVVSKRAEPAPFQSAGRAAKRPHWRIRCLEAMGLGWTLMALARKRRSV